MARTTTSRGPFARRTALLLIGIGASAFFAGLIVMAFSEYFDPTSGGRTNSYSSSAVGHLAAVELLEDLGFEVTVNRRDLNIADLPSSTLLLAEPNFGMVGSEIEEVLPYYSPVVLVLPKRLGVPDPFRPDWVAAAPPMPPNLALATAQTFLDDAEIVRPESLSAWQSDVFEGLAPDLEAPQLIRSSELAPLLATEEGMLIGVGFVDEIDLIVISDPDLISNHGLADGDNAAIFARLLDAAGGSSVIWDETVHGFGITENIWRSIFEPPFLAITIAAVLTITILLLATTYRFGSPLAMPKAIEEGKKSLVVTAASLLVNSRYYDDLMRRYLMHGMRRTMRQLNAPRGLNTPTLNEWLVRLGEARGLARATAEVPIHIHNALSRENLTTARLTGLVRDYFSWRTEILDGSERP